MFRDNAGSMKRILVLLKKAVKKQNLLDKFKKQKLDEKKR